MATEEDVRRIALARPEVTADDDTLGFVVRGKGFAWSWDERTDPEDPGALLAAYDAKGP